jgi:hypothetical protein
MGKISGYQSALRVLKKTLTSIVSDPWCQVCGGGENKVWRLVLHHLAYFSDSIIYKNYDTQTEIGKLQYHSSLALEVEQRPRNFCVLCNPCHKEVERLLDMGEERAEHVIKVELFRLNELVRETSGMLYNHRYEIERENYHRISYVYHESIRARKKKECGKHTGLDAFI